MGLRKAKGNMYDFVTHTWNPLGGTCPHGCSYCYMTAMRNRYHLPDCAPFLNERELKTNLGSGNYIFVGSSTDMFADYVSYDFVRDILYHCNKYKNTYLFHTKNPNRFYLYGIHLIFPPESIFCTTIETNRHIPKIMGTSPSPLFRLAALSSLDTRRKMITIEPVMDFDLSSFLREIKGCAPEQVNIGSDSGHNRLPEPPAEKVRELIAELRKFTVVHLKKNLRRLLPQMEEAK